MLNDCQLLFRNGTQHSGIGGFEILSGVHVILHHAADMVQHIIQERIIGESAIDQITPDAFIVFIENGRVHFRLG